MDLVSFRNLLCPLIVGLSAAVTHNTLPSICEELGLPAPGEGSKREKMQASFNALADKDLPHVAERLLLLHPPDPGTRNKIQDILWADSGTPELPKRFRRELAQTLDVEDLFLDTQRFHDLLDRLWVLNDDPFSIFSGVDRSLGAQIQQHVYRNHGDWDTEFLFDRLGAFDASDKRFALFLEGLASADVRPDEEAQRRLVDASNEVLRKCGVEMRESGSEGGYPVFTLVSLQATPKGRPKNLIFASSIKPDMRFKDAVNNDIEIVTNADKVLVYDRPITFDGLRWRDLQVWWSETQGILDDAKAKATLYRRLKESLPKNSPPQTLLFDAFYKGFGPAVPDFPALIPEVWLHWDPKTVKERGPDALLRFRMDFLLLLPHGVRVVIEVDGKQHYADGDRADTSRYAAMVAADRELKLAGYNVLRFGAEELLRPDAMELVKNFFQALFKQYGIKV